MNGQWNCSLAAQDQHADNDERALTGESKGEGSTHLNAKNQLHEIFAINQ
jgi:hypothetical protein